MTTNNDILDQGNFQNLPQVPDNQKLSAAEFNTIKNFQNSPAQQITGSLDDTNIIIDGTKQYSDTIVEAGATRTITANASGHFKGNFLIQRYTFDVDCTITLSGFDTTGNNTGTIAPIPAGTYDFVFHSKINGINLFIDTNADTLADGSGTTANDNAVDFGGVLSVIATIRKDNGIIYQILKKLSGDDGEFQQFIMSNTEFFLQYHSDAGDLDIQLGMEKSGAGVQAGGGLYIGIQDIAGSADKISGMNFGKTGLIIMGDISGSGRAIGAMYDSNYHAKWELLSAADKNRILPDIEWVKLNTKETIKIPLGARGVNHTQVTNKIGFHIDYNFYLESVTLEFDPVETDAGPTGSSFIVDVNVANIDGTSLATILSTKLSVDAGGFHSSTAATPAVLSSNTIAQYKFISIDIDQIGGTLAGKGGFVTLNGFRT